MASVGICLILLAILVHAVFLYSIFDIYFRSPILHGMSPQQSTVAPPAKRLVLFVADGLRADKFFSAHNTNMPADRGTNDADRVSPTQFLRSVIESKGVWGVSHTHVPTESRPGHVALIAGFYEDVSAITKGWKENPVEFDSVFNESRFTWSWGSPDILPMFAKGSAGNHIFVNTYSADIEDFAASNISAVDLWVFTKFEEFLHSAKDDVQLASKLAQDKIVFFFHLLALDSVGHGQKPASPEYMESIKVVDMGIERAIQSIEEYFNQDGRTAYIFTSDHGMTDWGSHGAGSLHETMTPLVAWGAGIRQPQSSSNTAEVDRFSQEWSLQHLRRSDINQVDIAPLMSSLIGAPIPKNSMGVLPVDFLYDDKATIAYSFYANVQQLIAQCQAHKNGAEATAFTLFFREFSSLPETMQLQRQNNIRALIKSGNYETAISETKDLVELTLEATHYYRTYNRLVLNCTIVLGFFGWMAYLASVVLENHSTVWSSSLEGQSVTAHLSIIPKRITVFLALGVLVFIRLHIKAVPYLYYVYFFIPIILWGCVDYRKEIFLALMRYIVSRGLLKQSIFLALMGICSLEILVCAFFHRELLSVGLWLIAVWPFTTQLKDSDKLMCCSWFASCLILSAFPLMPVVLGKEANYPLVYFSGWLCLAVAVCCARRPEVGLVRSNRRWQQEPQHVIGLVVAQGVLLIVAIYTLQNTVNSISQKSGLLILNQVLAWGILGASLILPLVGSTFMLTRLLHIALSWMSCYLLMSTSHEVLFILLLCIIMMQWLFLEYRLSDTTQRLQDLNFKLLATQTQYFNWHVKIDDLRRAYFLVYFILTSFFGTGNIASLNSFDPASVYCFVTVFSPFVMGFLMLLKIMIGFLVVACTFYSIVVILHIPLWSFSLLVLLLSDFMALHFFLFVRDSGSWLEIGMSISHYIIVMATTVFTLVLLGIARILTTKNISLSRIKIHLT